jgi:hypothetical protein
MRPSGLAIEPFLFSWKQFDGWDFSCRHEKDRQATQSNIESKALFYNRLSLVICILDFVARSLRCPHRSTSRFSPGHKSPALKRFHLDKKGSSLGRMPTPDETDVHRTVETVFSMGRAGLIWGRPAWCGAPRLGVAAET